MTSNGRLLKAVVAVALVAALAVPAAALAVPGRGDSGGKRRSRASVAASRRNRTPKPSSEASRQASRDARRAKLKAKVTFVLGRRHLRFDHAVAVLAKRIERVSGFAGRIEQAGGDVSAVRAKLDEAKALLDQAKVDEAKAVGMFKAVPDAADRKSAFAAARAQARTAVADLLGARRAVRIAILDLRSIASGLKGSGQ